MDTTNPVRAVPGVRWLACALLLAAAAGCGDGGTDTSTEPASAAAIPEERLALGPWEQRYGEDECTSELRFEIRALDPGDDAISRRPVAGARVELWAVTPDGTRLERKLSEATTGDDGNVTLGRAPEERWAVRVESPGYASALGGHRALLSGCVDLPLNAPGLLGLRPGREVPVEVRDRSGAPAAGVEVHASSIAFRHRATTDEQGRATLVTPAEPLEIYLAGVPMGPLRKAVDIPAEGPVEPVRLDAGVLEPVRGVVRDGAGGNPVAGAWVIVSGRPWVRTRSDAEGRFEIAAFPFDVLAGFAPGRGWRSLVVPEAGEVEVRLTEAVPVRGTVTGPGGEPLAGARLIALAPDVLGRLHRVWGPSSAEDGSFDFSWLPRPFRSGHPAVRLLALHRDHGFSEAVEVNEPAELTLRLPGTRSVAGKLVRHDGEAARGGRVFARWSMPGLDDGIAQRLGFFLESEAVINGDGSYRLSRVPLGAGATVAPDFEGWQKPVELDETSPPSKVQSIEFVAPAGMPIEGRVVTRGGDPLPAEGFVSLALLGEQRFIIDRSVAIGPDGTFAIPDVPEGRYQVTARVPGFDAGGTVAEAGDTDVVVTVERRSPVRVRVRFPDGTDELPSSVAVLLAQGATEATESAHAGNDWTVSFPGMWPGTYRLRAVGGVWRGRLDDVEVPDGRLLELTVDLVRTLRREAVLEDADGQPVPGAQVILSPQGIEGAHAQQAVSGSDGRLDLTGLRAGWWLLRCTPHGHVPIQQRFQVGPEHTATLNLRFSPSGKLALSASAGGEPLVGGIAALEDAAGNPVLAWPGERGALGSRFRLGEDGTLELSGVPAGTVVLRLSGGGLSAPVTRNVTIRRNETTSVTVP